MDLCVEDESDQLVTRQSPAGVMDSSFRQQLRERGVGEQTITELLHEEVCDMETFQMLQESHFGKLNEKLTLGQHALLLKIWEDLRVQDHDSGKSRQRTKWPINYYVIEFSWPQSR